MGGNAFTQGLDPRTQQAVQPPNGIPAPAVAGNLDPWNRKVWAHPNPFAQQQGQVQGPDSYGTTFSTSFTDENPKSPLFGKEVIVPTIINGYPFSERDAQQHYYNTGEHLGAFPGGQYDAANKYAQWLHEEQARRIAAGNAFRR